MIRLFIITLCFVVSSTLPADDKHEHKSVIQAKNPHFETLKSLVGTWYETDKDGKSTGKVAISSKLIGGGTAIHETIFPGQPEEMVTVYHLDGKDVVATHYCVLGNQPKLKLDEKSTAKKLIFNFAGGTNLDPAKDMHMHEGTISIVDANTIDSAWVGYVDGKPSKEHCMTTRLVRKK
jgi:hypothetical protein